MGDAAGEAADGFHFLGLLQLQFGQSPFGHIDGDAEQHIALAVRVEHETSMSFHVAPAAVG